MSLAFTSSKQIRQDELHIGNCCFYVCLKNMRKWKRRSWLDKRGQLALPISCIV